MSRRLAVSVLLALAATVAATASASTRATSALDVSWLKMSAQGDAFEIQGGKLALSKSQTPAVRALARRLVSDHSKSLGETKREAAKLNVKLEVSPTPSQKWELQMVATLSGKAFDVWYSKLELLDHTQDISEATDEATHGSNPDVTSMARKEVPTLRQHLALSKRALAAGNKES